MTQFKIKTGPGNFSNEFDYDYDLNSQTATIQSKDKIDLRKLDPWSLCYKEWLEKEHQVKVIKIQLVLNSSSKFSDSKFESFKRRISFLQLNNPTIEFEIISSTKITPLYSLNDLLNRPANEIINNKLNQRNAEDEPGRLEKDFQAFLFGGTILSTSNNVNIDYKSIYRRLGVLGVDFYQLKKDYKVLREFPTGVFDAGISSKSRILPTYFIDIVALNKRNEFSVIELKLNDSKIEVISQLLDYALYFRLYKDQISDLLKNDLPTQNLKNKTIACYVANNYYHPRFESISKYYVTNPKKFGFKIHIIILGATKAL